jgi:hypothetical protein
MLWISLILALLPSSEWIGSALQRNAVDPWKSQFNVDKGNLAARGRNQYFILEPGYQLTLAAGAEKLVITVLNETRIVDGVETRVVEERETKNNRIVEVSKNYFAISKSSGDVYYFGEEVDMYKEGKVTSHAGAWLSGVEGARFGLMMPGEVQVGAMYYQELAPRKAMDRAHIVSTVETVVTPAGTHKNCLKIEETTPLEPGVKEYKYYTAGIGLIRDGALTLVSYGNVR